MLPSDTWHWSTLYHLQNIPESCDRETLEAFIEEQGNCRVRDVIYGMSVGQAIIKINDELGKRQQYKRLLVKHLCYRNVSV